MLTNTTCLTNEMLSKWPGAENAHICPLTWKTVCLDSISWILYVNFEFARKKKKKHTPEKSSFSLTQIKFEIWNKSNIYHKKNVSTLYK